MEQKVIELGGKKYRVRVAETVEEKRHGLMEKESMPKDEGMIFIWDEPHDVTMWMKNTLIPLDIIYINEDQEVTAVEYGKPEDETRLTHENTMYVVELNSGSGVKKGDQLDFSDEELPVMKVLAPDGSTQMELQGGERIFSRKSTRVILRKAIRAYKSKSDTDYKALGKYVFKELYKQDHRDPEYVTLPK